MYFIIIIIGIPALLLTFLSAILARSVRLPGVLKEKKQLDNHNKVICNIITLSCKSNRGLREFQQVINASIKNILDKKYFVCRQYRGKLGAPY